MAPEVARKKLMKEYKRMQESPPPYIKARRNEKYIDNGDQKFDSAPNTNKFSQVEVNEKNILECEGPPETPFEGGYYVGKLVFPTQYPYKPPSIMMLTPNGRFETNRRICLSMSDFHPETWNPLWSTSSVLTGLLSFMCEDEITTGAIRTSDAEKRRLAKESLEWNMKNPSFRRLFPSLETVAEQKQQQEQKQEQGEHEAALTTAEDQDGTGEAARAAARGEWLMERLLALVQRAQSILAFLFAAMGVRPRPQRA